MINMKESEWTNIKTSIEYLLKFIKQEDEDDEWLKEDLEIWVKRSDKTDPNRKKLSAQGRVLLEQLGMRPMPAERIAKDRTPGQVAIHGCPRSPCVGKQHCSVCGLHGKRFGDGHICDVKMG